MSRKTPIRRCVGCGERRAKNELIRVVYNKDTGEVKLDKKGKAPGRGAYLCPDKKCLEKAKKSKNFSRTLKISISDEIYNKLMEEIDRMEE